MYRKNVFGIKSSTRYQPRYNTVHYNTVLDITRVITGPKMVFKRLILLYGYTFSSRYKTDWIASTEIGLNPNNSVIKRLWILTTHMKVIKK